MKKPARLTKAAALELCRQLFGADVAVTTHRVQSYTPGRYYETVYAVHRPGTGKQIGRSLFGFREAIERAADNEGVAL